MTSRTRLTTSYKNPWYSGPSGINPEQYTINDCLAEVSACGRGVIIEKFPHHFDHVVGGRVVTQLAGSNMALLNQLIPFILDGKKCDYMYKDRALDAYNKGK